MHLLHDHNDKVAIHSLIILGVILLTTAILLTLADSPDSPPLSVVEKHQQDSRMPDNKEPAAIMPEQQAVADEARRIGARLGMDPSS